MIIVVWASSTRCSVHNTEDEALETVKNLMEDNYTADEIQVYRVEQPFKIKVSLEPTAIEVVDSYKHKESDDE